MHSDPLPFNPREEERKNKRLTFILGTILTIGVIAFIACQVAIRDWQ
ncbi:hypothetical protein [Glycomyces artemisiae]|uniref:Uncharacterized protein n=1 Tax=Glycomyces artemisiae TaxID=1076443 RepID=A0A2T0URU2_9ACTN|nr:hypothetical protein [Glycomyces artemisiae]PRY60567.1 hypothetical protein B0I28_102172 [Glycomyces artemisiae]